MKVAGMGVGVRSEWVESEVRAGRRRGEAGHEGAGRGAGGGEAGVGGAGSGIGLGVGGALGCAGLGSSWSVLLVGGLGFGVAAWVRRWHFALD